MPFQLTQTTVTVEGNSGNIIFSNLIINQYLADVNSFSFNWRQQSGASGISDQVNFYEKNLGKEVTVNIEDNYEFHGIIYAIDRINNDALGTEYNITGKGLFVKLDEVIECNSFYKQTFEDIFNAVNTADGTTFNLSPANTDELFYTVQYNQTAFEFCRMLAARYGEWLYYDGQAMVLEAPSGEAADVTTDVDLHNINIRGRIVKTPSHTAGFDRYQGNILTHDPEAPTGEQFIGAAIQRGQDAFGSNQKITHLSGAATGDHLETLDTLLSKATASTSVTLTAQSNNSKIKLGGKINILNAEGDSEGEYIVTEIHHSCFSENNYQNQFVAVPAEIQVPPYTNPFLFPVCRPQPALVTDNDDQDGHDRVKVHFPWQQTDDKTPWINVLSPYAGSNKGVHFIPEVNEEVLIGFESNNAEKPYVMGAFHTEKSKAGFAHGVKVTGTASGRRLEIDDEKSQLALLDNFYSKYPMNSIFMSRSNDNVSILIGAAKNDNNNSLISLDDKNVTIQVTSGTDAVCLISMEQESKKLTVQSQGSIDISADGDINIKGANINIKASQELNLEGTANGANLKGQQVKVEADTQMNIKGLTATVEGTSELELKSSVLASLSGTLVKIN